MPPLRIEGFTPEFLAALTIIGEAMGWASIRLMLRKLCQTTK